MAGLSRAKAASIQILRTSELKAAECKRPAIVQFHVRTAPSQVAAPRLCPELGACPPGLGPLARGSSGPVPLGPPLPLYTSAHRGAHRDQQESAGQSCLATRCRRISSPPSPRPLTSPCRRKRSSSRSPTAPSRRRRPTRPPSRRRPRRPSSVRWIHRYVNIVVPPLVSIDRINTKAFRHAGPPDRTKSTMPPAGKIDARWKICMPEPGESFSLREYGDVGRNLCERSIYAQRE